jgi:hypothetical protein
MAQQERAIEQLAKQMQKVSAQMQLNSAPAIAANPTSAVASPTRLRNFSAACRATATSSERFDAPRKRRRSIIPKNFETFPTGSGENK